MLTVRWSVTAEADLSDIGRWTLQHLGEEAVRRYRILIRTAVDDVAEDPLRRGSNALTVAGVGEVRRWPLRLSSSRAAQRGAIVRQSRHLLFYRVEAAPIALAIGRILHGSMDLPRHLSDPRIWS